MRVRDSQAHRITLSEREMDYLCFGGLSVNQGVQRIVRVLMSLEGKALADLRGAFTSGEWKFMADMLKDADINAEHLADVNELCRVLSMAKGLRILSEHYAVDPFLLRDKIAQYTGVHALAIYHRCMDYWDNCEEVAKLMGSNDFVSFDDWARY